MMTPLGTAEKDAVLTRFENIDIELKTLSDELIYVRSLMNDYVKQVDYLRSVVIKTGLDELARKRDKK